MITYLKQISLKVIQIVEGIWRGRRFLWAVFVLVFAGLLVVDLFRIPVSVNSSYQYAPEQTLWRKMTPQEDQRLKDLQAHCHHIYIANGRVFYYCPICRTKLTRATAPLWQI